MKELESGDYFLIPGPALGWRVDGSDKRRIADTGPKGDKNEFIAHDWSLSIKLEEGGQVIAAKEGKRVYGDYSLQLARMRWSDITVVPGTTAELIGLQEGGTVGQWGTAFLRVRVPGIAPATDNT
jgi:hypothetical protein